MTSITMETSVTWLLVSCFIWSTLYFLLCLLNPKRSYEWHIRTVTTIHAVIVVLLSTYCVLVLGPWPFTSCGGTNTDFQQFIIMISLSYFLLDFSWCIYFRTEGPVMLLHHSCSVIGLSNCFVLRLWGTELVTTVLGAEITNPLLQLRWFLRETNQYDSLLGDVVDVAFMVLFGVFRICVGSYFLYTYYQQDTDFLGRLGGTIIYSIGWVFWLSIVQYGYKKYNRKYGSGRRKKVEGTGEKSSGKGSALISNGVNGNHVISATSQTEVNGNVMKISGHVNGLVKDGEGLHKRVVHETTAAEQS